jgi:hypothetical protein
MELTNTPDFRDSMQWFAKSFEAKDYKDFKSKYPAGSEELSHIGRILGSFEIAGVFVSHGLLNEDLYFDASGIGFVWGKVEKIIPGWQKDSDPALWENAVWLAERQKEWKKEVWKPNQAWKKSATKRKSS